MKYERMVVLAAVLLIVALAIAACSEDGREQRRTGWSRAWLRPPVIPFARR
jgi:hypothetical protein